MATSMWSCPRCARAFTRTNQRHACGTGTRDEVLRDRPAQVVALYDALERFALSLGGVELVTRERYVLLRSQRVFADAVLMTNALRLAIHLPRPMQHELFIKTASDGRQVTHVARLVRVADLERMKPFLRQAYVVSLD